MIILLVKLYLVLHGAGDLITRDYTLPPASSENVIACLNGFKPGGFKPQRFETVKP